MNVIPVIDLLHGQVVHARHGHRHDYRPMVSALCDGSEPVSMVAALLRLYSFTQLYIADLDAIQGLGNHEAIIADISRHYPQLQIWLDAGFSSAASLGQWQHTQIVPVLGSESLRDMEHYRQLVQACAGDHVLSLDFKAGCYTGPPALLTTSDDWPAQVIGMTLQQVGSNAGPDRQQLQQLQAMAPQQMLYAAGGIRNADDLRHLADMGIAGALVASALHAKAITGEQLMHLM